MIMMTTMTLNHVILIQYHVTVFQRVDTTCVYSVFPQAVRFGGPRGRMGGTRIGAGGPRCLGAGGPVPDGLITKLRGGAAASHIFGVGLELAQPALQRALHC